MANYSREKGKYGGMVGTIQPFCSYLPLANDPSSTEFRELIPAGFLRCDGSVQSADNYPELASMLGTGEQSRFKKEDTILTDDQFQLPDLGSKYIRPGLSTGSYSDLTLEQDETKKRVGSEFSITSNVGNTATISYSGNFRVGAVSSTLITKFFDAGPGGDITTANRINITSHGFSANQVVTYVRGSGTVPTGLTDNAKYYIRVVNANVVELATTPGGAATPITANSGSGTNHALTSGLPLLGNPKLLTPVNRTVDNAALTDQNFQAHGHMGNQTVLNYTGRHLTATGGKSGNDARVLAGNELLPINPPDGTSFSSSIHTHRIDMPTSFPHNFAYGFSQFDAPADNLVTTVNLSVKNVKTIDSVIAPFILVEYIIKY